MMLKIAIFAFSVVVLVTAITYRDCVPHEGNRVVSVSKLEVTPDVITFPGTFNVSVTLTFNREVKEPFVDFELIRYFLGFPLKLPCSGSSVVGTCKDIPICWLFERSLNDTDPAHYDSYGHKLERLMNATTGHFWKCPIQKQTVVVENAPFNLTEISPLIHLLANGDYKITVFAKENKTGPIIGCIEVNATIGGESTGSIFG
ncbi:uncharacterized protein LOC123553280 [Mercenaria mercenaria]|uniref:uncharacterized protein LOC123553280 n=1 Tax=Mercenaria mercenaria TaxID=6596 RepID=UPI00234E8D86|nr:uncharacterized protein LOC123553280 [Mercenaria mercenaria]